MSIAALIQDTEASTHEFRVHALRMTGELLIFPSAPRGIGAVMDRTLGDITDWTIFF